MERQQARRTYEQARQEGKTASLLEQQRPNVFQMNVANILPGDEIKVELKYTELIEPEDRTYEFVYPGVVGASLFQNPVPRARRIRKRGWKTRISTRDRTRLMNSAWTWNLIRASRWHL